MQWSKHLAKSAGESGGRQLIMVQPPWLIQFGFVIQLPIWNLVK